MKDERGVVNGGRGTMGDGRRVVDGEGRTMNERGTSVLDLLLVVAVIALASGIAVAQVGRAVTDVREVGAARAFAMRIRQLRADAVRRSTAVGLQFVAASGGTRFRAYADGNANGLRTRDIAIGVDPALAPPETLAPLGRGVAFGLSPTVPSLGEDEGALGDEEGTGDGSAGEADAIRLGSSDLLTFGPTGSGTSGTIYVRGPTRQFAVRIYGVTGRIRLLEYRRASSAWVEW